MMAEKLIWSCTYPVDFAEYYTQQWAQPVTAGVHGVSSRKYQLAWTEVEVYWGFYDIRVFVLLYEVNLVMVL